MESKGLTPIKTSYPDAENLKLQISVGACRLVIRPGGDEAWVKGTYDDPTGKLPVQISQKGGTLRITQERDWTALFGVFERPPVFDLALGTGRSYTLTLETGASESQLDLGGLPISRLDLRLGAGKMTLDFSNANPQEMSHLKLSGGAGGLEIGNLANANFSAMQAEGGAASFELDFSGALQRNAQVSIATGVSSVRLVVPATTAAKISSESVLGDLNVGDGFMNEEGTFWTEAALAGSTPVLNIRASVTIGSLQLRTL